MLVWYAVTMRLGLRGGEVQCKLQKSPLYFEKEEEGKEEVSVSSNFMSKNCPGGLEAREFASAGRIYEPLQIAAIRRLLEKLHPDIDRLFQPAFAKCPNGQKSLVHASSGRSQFA